MRNKEVESLKDMVAARLSACEESERKVRALERLYAHATGRPAGPGLATAAGGMGTPRSGTGGFPTSGQAMTVRVECRG